MSHLLKNTIKRLKSNLAFENEYICVDEAAILRGIKVIFTIGSVNIDVTHRHLFLGYSPLTIAIPKNLLKLEDTNATLIFSTDNKFCGKIELRLSTTSHSSLHFFEGVSASHNLLSQIQKLYHWSRNKIKSKAHPLYPSENSYNQLRVAYSFPRNISLLVVCHKNQFNIFPTDLHGELTDENKYIISLRENGKALEQISKADSITLSRIRVEYFVMAYSLGKNHMQNLASRDFFGDLISEAIGNPQDFIANNCFQYNVLNKVHECGAGIHRFLTFSISKKITIMEDQTSLSHIHEYYASWRRRNNFKDELFIRQ